MNLGKTLVYTATMLGLGYSQMHGQTAMAKSLDTTVETLSGNFNKKYTLDMFFSKDTVGYFDRKMCNDGMRRSVTNLRAKINIASNLDVAFRSYQDSLGRPYETFMYERGSSTNALKHRDSMIAIKEFDSVGDITDLQYIRFDFDNGRAYAGDSVYAINSSTQDILSAYFVAAKTLKSQYIHVLMYEGMKRLPVVVGSEDDGYWIYADMATVVGNAKFPLNFLKEVAVFTDETGIPKKITANLILRLKAKRVKQ